MDRIEHRAALWRWTTPAAPAAWFFLSIGGAAGESLTAIALMRRLESGKPRGFGALRVTVRIGGSRWQTSLFPQKGKGWMVPVKAAVRRSEGIGEGDVVTVIIEV